MLPKYLVRLDDSTIFVLNREYNRYWSLELPRMDQPYDHFTYENLTADGDFIPLEGLVSYYLKDVDGW